MDHNPKTDDKNTKSKIWFRDLKKFAELLGCFYAEDQVDGLFNQIFQQMGINNENFEGILSVADNMKRFHDFLRQFMKAALTPVCGVEAGHRLRLKITYDKQGYAQVANFDYVENMSNNPSALSMDDYDAKMLAAKQALDAKKQAEAVAGKVGGPGSGPGTPGNPAAQAPVGAPPVQATAPASPVAAAPAATPVVPATDAPVQQPFTEQPSSAVFGAPVPAQPAAIPVAIPVVQ